MSNTSSYVTEYIPSELQRSVANKDYPWVILCDFDGTISLKDVTDTLLGQFGLPGHEELEEAWQSGKIGSRECMRGQIALLDASKEELDAALAAIAIDPAFAEFVQQAKALGIPVKIVSDGLDYAIHHILHTQGLDVLPVYANRLVQAGERRWRLEFPQANSLCVKASGNCKCARVAVYQQRAERVLFVGDGSSDFCASGKVDFVLAKDKLIRYCTEQGIEHMAIQNFSQVLAFVQQHLQPQRELASA